MTTACSDSLGSGLDRRSGAAVQQESQLSRPLLEQYREVLFTSLITSCGLDALLFRDDEANGHVDTLHNVAESQKNGQEPIFKKEAHAQAHKARGEYNSAEYHSDKAYIAKGKEFNALRDQGKLIDGHTGQPILPGQKFDRDHVIAAKTLHDDGRFALSGLDPRVLANQDSNLVPTDRSVNRSKKDMPATSYAEKLSRQHEARTEYVRRLKAEIQNGTAPDGAEKTLHKEQQKLLVDKKRMEENEKAAERRHRSEHNRAYYTSRDFLGTTALSALSSGVRMAQRQALGLILMELSAAVYAEVPAMLHDWRSAPDWKTKLDPRQFLARLGNALAAAWERIKAKAGPIFKAGVSGFGAGVLAEIITTVINIFEGTAKSVMRLMRNFWAGIMQSVEIILFNKDNLDPEARLAAVMRILSIAVGGMIQPVIAEVLNKFMETHATVIPAFVREVVSEFAGAAVGGLVSVTLVYAIDHSPVVHAIMVVARKAGALTQEVYRQVAHYAGMTWEALESATQGLREIGKSPAFNMAVLFTAPPLGIALAAYNHLSAIKEDTAKTLEHVERVEAKIVDLEANIQSGFRNIDALVKESNAMLHCVLANQDQQMTMLTEIRQEMRTGFEKTLVAIQESAVHAAGLVTLRGIQETLTQLMTRYRNCTEVLRRGELPSSRELGAIDELASVLSGKYETSLGEQPAGAASRFPLLSGMAFALSVRHDVKNLMQEQLTDCHAEGQRLANIARNELRVLWSKATFWERTQERAWLIGQYAILRRTLSTITQTRDDFAWSANDNDIMTAPSFGVTGWNDGLDVARDVFEACKYERPETTISLRTSEEREGWRQLAGLPRAMIVNEIPMQVFREQLGIPADVPLGARVVELLRTAPQMIAYNHDLLISEIG